MATPVDNGVYAVNPSMISAVRKFSVEDPQPAGIFYLTLYTVFQYFTIRFDDEASRDEYYKKLVEAMAA